MSADKPTRTVAEALDAAQTGEEFGGVLWRLFAAADAARDKADISASWRCDMTEDEEDDE
jgi:hypothetical protein